MSTRRVWLFRLGAVVLGLAPLLLAELICVVFDWGRPSPRQDPFVGFSSIQPLFELSEDGSQYEIAAARREFFAPDEFAAEKGSDEFRIFCLGGSTVQGRPYSTPTAFPTWLEIALAEADDGNTWKAVNCGGISYASYRLVPILEEILQYDPDLIVLCTGHNEFLEDRTYGHIRQTPAVLERPLRFLSQRRLCVLLREAGGDDSGAAAESDHQRPTLEAEVDAMLDYRNGLAAYYRDDAWRERVIEHFEFNVRRMVAVCQAADVPLILITPPSNLSDQPPFKSEHGAGLNADDIEEWNVLVAEAQSLYRTDVSQSAVLLEQALEIDDRVSSTWYELGKCREAARQHDAARDAFIRARDEDICALRMLSAMEEIVSRIAHEESLSHLNAHILLESETPLGVLGDQWLVDHVHPSPEGHQMIAQEILESMADLELVSPVVDWKDAVERASREHLSELSDFYFLKGQRTIDSLLHWTRGEADGPLADDRFPHRIHE